jgi:hypothetical protein
MEKILVKRQRLSNQSEHAHCENTTTDSPGPSISVKVPSQTNSSSSAVDLRTLDLKIIHVLSVLYAAKNCKMKVWLLSCVV